MADSKTSVTFLIALWQRHPLQLHPVPLSRDDSLLFLVPCSSAFLTILHPRPVPLSRNVSLLFLVLYSSPFLGWPTSFPASRGMTSGLLTALCAKEETAYTSTPPFHSFCAHAFASRFLLDPWQAVCSMEETVSLLAHRFCTEWLWWRLHR
jgi:hypothetical protein